MVEDKKLGVRKCGELAKARLALEKGGDLLQNKKPREGLLYFSALFFGHKTYAN